MKIEIILELISGLFLILGCTSYIMYNRRENENQKKVLIVLCVIFTAIGIGLFVGATNKPYTPKEDSTEEIIEEDINEDEINL